MSAKYNGKKVLSVVRARYLDLDALYPVGSIYLSVASTNPHDLFGGTWEQLKDKFLLGAGDTYSNGAIGGEAEHTLSINEMPSHNHRSVSSRLDVGAGSGSIEGVQYSAGLGTVFTSIEENAGGGQPHNNMPPYLVVYMWKRTA